VSQLGPYEVVRSLGTGGFARTCEARHVLLGERACLKVSLRAEDEPLLLREAKSLWSLQHPSLPVLRDVFPHPGGGVVLAMSFAEGQTLDRLAPLTVAEGCRVGAKVLRALAYLHLGGIVHCDVKPRNVVVSSAGAGGRVVLVDFGLAAVRPTRATRPLGWTEGFVAPEVAAGLPPLPESDLFALGKTLEVVLAGRSLPERLHEFLAALTHPEPSRRPRWDKRDPLRWLEEIRSEVNRDVRGARDPNTVLRGCHV
jgi:serine/threonine protein kinase